MPHNVKLPHTIVQTVKTSSFARSQLGLINTYSSFQHVQRLHAVRAQEHPLDGISQYFVHTLFASTQYK